MIVGLKRQSAAVYFVLILIKIATLVTVAILHETWLTKNDKLSSETGGLIYSYNVMIGFYVRIELACLGVEILLGTYYEYLFWSNQKKKETEKGIEL